jgi:peptide/nickel transport system permease protein
MISFLYRRVGGGLAVLLAISLLAFVLTYLMPGDPAYIIVARRRSGQIPTAAELEKLRDEFGLDKPLVVQYILWLGETVQGSFGYSMRSGMAVSDEIRLRLGPTLLLAGVTIVITVLFSIPIGFLSAWRENSFWDHATRSLALLGVSVPNFWLGFLLILIFSVYMHWLPTYGIGNVKHLIMPVICLSLTQIAHLSRLTRSSFLEVRREGYLLTARSKGLNHRTALFKHGLPNISGPLIALIATQFSYIVAGSVVVETLFAWPGLGNYFILSVRFRDIPAVQTLVLLYSAVFVLLNIIADGVHAMIDPRIRLE